jgi:hypothetical protein
VLSIKYIVEDIRVKEIIKPIDEKNKIFWEFFRCPLYKKIVLNNIPFPYEYL